MTTIIRVVLLEAWGFVYMVRAAVLEDNGVVAGSEFPREFSASFRERDGDRFGWRARRGPELPM